GQITDLIDKGHEVEIISAGMPKEETIHEDVLKYELLAKTHCDVRSPSNLGFGVNERLLPALIFTDLIHAHFAAEPTDLAMKISKMFDLPFVFTAHAYDIFINPDVFKLREKFDKAKKVITVSNYNKEYLLNLLGRDLERKIEVIRCGIDLDKFEYVERTSKDTIKIFLVGRFVEKKGITYAIKAVSEVLKEYQNVELRIIGDGSLKEDIDNLINTLNLKGKVITLGSQPQSEVLKEMKDADIFLLPSVTAENGDREGVPVSIMEAQATGLPVVSTLHTGVPEVVIDGKTGFLVPEKDTYALAERLKELIKNPALRANMGKEGREYIKVNYNHKKEMKQLEHLLKDLIKDKPLMSDMPKEYQEIIEQRVKNFGDQLDSLDNEIKEKDNQVKQLRGHLDYIQNTVAYRMYTRIVKPFGKWIKP
ncbi:glycosyltransferase, partial [bacterium]|nr:glycosyltransferase [bacterium]